jgi:hypothetical protein
MGARTTRSKMPNMATATVCLIWHHTLEDASLHPDHDLQDMQNIFLNIGHRVTLPSDRVNERRLYEFVFHVLRLRLISPRAAPSKKREAALVDRVVPEPTAVRALRWGGRCKEG